MLCIILREYDGSEENPRVLAVVESVGPPPDFGKLFAEWRQLYPEAEADHEFGEWLENTQGCKSPPFAVEVV